MSSLILGGGGPPRETGGRDGGRSECGGGMLGLVFLKFKKEKACIFLLPK